MRVNRAHGVRRFLVLPIAVAIAALALSAAPARAAAFEHDDFRTLDHPGAGTGNGMS